MYTLQCIDSNVNIISGFLLLAFLVMLFFLLGKRKKIKDIKTVEKVDENNTYGTYDLNGEMSDYSTVEDTNVYYGQ